MIPATKDDIDRLESKIDVLIADVRLLAGAVRDHRTRIAQLESRPPPPQPEAAE